MQLTDVCQEGGGEAGGGILWIDNTVDQPSKTSARASARVAAVAPCSYVHVLSPVATATINYNL